MRIVKLEPRVTCTPWLHVSRRHVSRRHVSRRGIRRPRNKKDAEPCPRAGRKSTQSRLVFMSGSIPEGARVGSMVTLEAIQARFCDGTDLRAKKKKKKKKRHQGIGVSAQQGPKNVEVGAPPERYFIVEGELDSGFLNFRAFLFNDMLLLATPQDVEGPYFSAKC